MGKLDVLVHSPKRKQAEVWKITDKKSVSGLEIEARTTTLYVALIFVHSY